MVLEEQILHYYLRVFKLIIIFILILIFFYSYYIINKEVVLSSNSITIQKGESIEEVLEQNTTNFSEFDIFVIKIYIKIKNTITNEFIHFGDFILQNNLTIAEILKIISKPSNVINKVTIIEGWSQKDLEKELSKYFDDVYQIPFEDIIADTYFLNKNNDFNYFVNNLKKIKLEFLSKYKDYNLYKNYSELDIMIIGSMIEKEGLDYRDKKKIASVIINRLNKNMKLQIDATVLYAITDGNYDLKRNLLYNDLKFESPFNTYLYKGLPPKPISYVGKKTLDILFENHKTDFLFYFFNNSLKRHEFSKTFNDHKKKLNEYRDTK